MRDDIIRVTADYFHLPAERLLGKERHRAIARPRMVCYWLLRMVGWLSLPEIGRTMGRNHTTVLHGIRFVERSTLLLDDAAAIRGRLQDAAVAAQARAGGPIDAPALQSTP